MAISNLNNELYEDDVMTEEVTSASFSASDILFLYWLVAT